jgi:hypothetical protein
VNNSNLVLARTAARNKRAGAHWQNALRDGLRSAGLDVERLVLTGSEDEGDLMVRTHRWDHSARVDRIVIEAKAGVLHAADFVDQTLEEASHFARHRGLVRSQVMGIAVIKRRRRSWNDAYVLTSVGEYFRIADEDARFNPSGRSWTRVLCNGLRFAGRDAELIVRQPYVTEGDLVVRDRGRTTVIKSKTGDLRVAELIDQMHVEVAAWCRNRDTDPRTVDGITIVKRRGRPWSDAYVFTTVEDFFGLNEYEDTFADVDPENAEPAAAAEARVA